MSTKSQGIISISSIVLQDYLVRDKVLLALGYPNQTEIRNRAVVAAGKLNHELTRTEALELSDELAKIAMDLRRLAQ